MNNKPFKIDLVVPYVDNTDPIWCNMFNKYNDEIKTATDTANRFRANTNFFRLFFRCVECNMSWIDNIFLLVSTESQVPDWLDKKKVKIITHANFIPMTFLPTFNSGTIEMFLQNIPGLSEHFIYANDDFFMIKPCTYLDFFTEDGSKCKFNYLYDTDSSRNMWRQMCRNNHDVIFGTHNIERFMRLDHEFRPYLKSQMAACFLEHRAAIENSISRFRAPKNLTCFLFSLYLVKKQYQLPTDLKFGYLCDTSGKMSIKTNLTKDQIVLNDTDKNQIWSNPLIIDFFKTNFDAVSKYEVTKWHLPQLQLDARADGRSGCYLYF